MHLPPKMAPLGLTQMSRRPLYHPRGRPTTGGIVIRGFSGATWISSIHSILTSKTHGDQKQTLFPGLIVWISEMGPPPPKHIKYEVLLPHLLEKLRPARLTLTPPGCWRPRPKCRHRQESASPPARHATCSNLAGRKPFDPVKTNTQTTQLLWLP